ncbi:allophanate hydrolase [Lacisediminimonas profundi]|uniref:allophanate hydrolase n=1 Tax=Lacisediminimonas profundi TaxID=2603856 RepID=UPI00124BB079|nr:allophanate hydrolase [Lacisediminimonas profundi]
MPEHENTLSAKAEDRCPAALAVRAATFRAAADDAAPSIWISRGPIISEPGPGLSATPQPLANKLFAVKDNIDVAGYPTTAACPDFAYSPQRSATVVQRLLQAGAAVAGKTNLDQFACGLVGTRSPYGAVPNAFNPAYISGGSSSGSAVAVALGLVDFALGTDTAGSGRVPAGFNNIVGLKPSRGLLSTRGVLPACAHIDCPSIFARTVAEAVHVLLAAAGHDPEDPWSRHLPLDNRAFPSRFRFGMPDAAHLDFCGDEQSASAFQDAVARLVALGGEASEIDYEPLSVAATELYESAWVAERYAAIRDFFDQHPDSIDPVVRQIIGNGRGYDAAQLFDAMRRMAGLRQRAMQSMAAIDVLVVPTAPTIYTLAELAEQPVSRNRNLGLYTNAVNLLDLAAIAVPSSMRADGLPFGITLIGPAGSELRLAELAARYHAASGLGLGTSAEPVPAAQSFAHLAGGTVEIAVVGAHLSGMPLNWQLTERGARLVRRTRSAAHYRLYALAGTVPPKPGLLRVASGQGAQVELEIWQLPVASYGSFVALIPAPLGIGTLDLEDGSQIQGFLCEQGALGGARDISSYGGWRAFMAAVAPATTESPPPPGSSSAPAAPASPASDSSNPTSTSL